MNTQNPKMNRLIPTVSILLILAMTIFLMTSCGQEKKGNNHAANGTTGVADLLQSAENASNPTTDTKPSTIATVPSETPSTATLPEEPETSKSKDGIDVDLSQVSATTVYAEVLGMIYEPEKYKGKTVKMKGNFSVYHDETTGKYYFACIIQDATACCSQGIEFSLKGDPKYPDDYPQEGAEITVIGTFDSYEEGNYLYLILRDAELVSETSDPTDSSI